MPGETCVVRDPAVVVVSRGDACLVIRPGQPALVMEDVDGQAVAALLELTVLPIAIAEVAEHASDETLALLVDQGLLWRGSRDELEQRLPRREPSPASRPCRRIVVGISGAVSAAASLDQVITISRAFADEVDVVLTDGARKFVRASVFEHWGFRTWSDPFRPRHGQRVPHIHLAGADLVLVAPASAGALHRLATGACSDLLSLVVAATAAPVVVAPVMNAQMWRSPAVARNVAQLRDDGVWVIEPGIGFEMAHADRPGDIGGLGYRYNTEGLLRALTCVLDRRA